MVALPWHIRRSRLDSALTPRRLPCRRRDDEGDRVMRMPRRAVEPATLALPSAGVTALPFNERLVAQARIAVHGTGIRATR